MSCDRSIRLFLTGCLWGSLLFPATAQVVPDDSLGAENSVVTKDEAIDLIEGGAVRDTSLFHSFSKFGIPDGQQVYFANPDGITDILSRVTGNNVSEIFGTLGVRGAANLFLLNPNGIVFGENASLDLNGSFLATTADSFEFAEDNYSYDATNPNSPPLLTVNIPVGLQFGSEIGAIEVRGTGHNLILNPQLTINKALRPAGLGLEVAEGNTLALIGGEINFSGGNLTAPGGEIVLGSVEQAEEVGLQATEEEFVFDFQNFDRFNNVELTQASSLDLSGEGSGSLQIQAQNISLIDNSAIVANTNGSGNGGELDFKATDSLRIIGSETTNFPSAIFTQVASEATGNGSSINITATEFQLQDNAALISSTAGSGNAGAIELQVQQADLANKTNTSFRTGTGFISRVSRGATGKGGDIDIEVKSEVEDKNLATDLYSVEPGELQLQDGAKIRLLTNGEGESGNLSLNAERVDILGIISDKLISSEINTEVGINSTNNGGRLNIAANQLNIANGGQISSGTGGSGSGGDLEITADEIDIFGLSATNNLSSSISTSAAIGNTSVTGDEGNLTIVSDRLAVADGGFIGSQTKGFGDSGDLQIDTDTLFLNNGGQIRSQNNGLGKSGKLLVNANETTVDGTNNQPSGLFTSITRIEDNTSEDETPSSLELQEQTNSDESAESNFVINGAKLTVQNGGEIVSSTSGIADAENLRIVATDALKIEDGARVGSFTSGNGNAGSLSIEAGKIDIGISEETRAAFDGDESTKTMPGSLFSRVEELARGDGGEINITTQDLEIDYGGQISANTSGEGDAGDIILNAENITVQDSVEIDGVRSGISSGVESSGSGNGGEIEIKVDRNLLVSRGGSIGVDARSENIDPYIEITAGSINIQAGNIEISESLDPATVAEFAQSSPLKSRISAFSEGTSNSGDVKITADTLSIIDSGELAIAERAGISVRNKEQGSAGNIALDVGELTLAGGQLNAEVNSGTRGNVSLNTNNISITEEGGINTQASGDATSGNITINNTGNIFLEDSEIVADATQGNAGNIQIDTVGLFRDRASQISASSELGIDGVVALNTSFDAGRNLGAAFPQKPLDPDIKSTQSCETNDNKNNFAYIGRGGLPVNPLDRVADSDLLIDWSATEAIVDADAGFDPQLTANSYSLDERPVRQNDSSDRPTEAQGWQLNSAGKIELIATTGKPALSGLGRCWADKKQEVRGKR